MRTTLTALLLVAASGLFTPERSPAQTLPSEGGGCDPVHEGCPSDPFIEACDSCSLTAIRRKALSAATQEGPNHVFVVDRPAREVVHYLVSVTFTSTGVNKAADDIGFTTERSQAIKTILEEGADVYTWFRTSGRITASELANLGIHVNHSSGFDFASDSKGTLDLEGDLYEYMGKGVEPLDEWRNTLDRFKSLFSEIVVFKLADRIIDPRWVVTFEWPDGSTVRAKLTVSVEIMELTVELTGEVLRQTLESANGDPIYPSLASYGIGAGGGITDPIYVGDPSYRDDLRAFLDFLGGSGYTTTKPECDQSGYCTATLSRN